MMICFTKMLRKMSGRRIDNEAWDLVWMTMMKKGNIARSRQIYISIKKDEERC